MDEQPEEEKPPFNEHFVFHGSPEFFDLAVPTRHVRSRRVDGERKTIFDGISYHATGIRWIATAYTYARVGYEIDGKIAYYNMGVSLYDYSRTITIYGFESLHHSLKVLYGQGGWLYYFRTEDFFHVDGLGDLEVICDTELKPHCTEWITSPVDEMRSAGVEFEFVDLALPENESSRNYA